MATNKVERPLGQLECFSSSRHSLGFYRCVALTCRYDVPFWVQNMKKVQLCFYQALKDVIDALPILRMGIRGEHTKTPAFVRVESVRLSNHLQWRQVRSGGVADDLSILATILEDEHDQLFQDVHERPPWRMVCAHFTNSRTEEVPGPLGSVWIIFAVHHALADGISAKIFHSRLLEALNWHDASSTETTGRNAERDIILPLHDVKLAPPIEALVKFNISWPFFLTTLWNEFAPSWLRGPQATPPWTGRPIALEPSHVNIRIVQIPGATLSAVLEVCRAQRISFTALMHAVVAYSVARRIPEAEAKSFASITPINLRRFMGASGTSAFTPETLMGVHITAAEHTFDKATLEAIRTGFKGNEICCKPIWTVARKVGSDLEKRLAVLPNDDKIGLLPWVSDWHARWLKMLHQPRESTWEVSNLGSMSGTSSSRAGGKGRWTITDAVFTQSANVAGPAFSVNVVSVTELGASISISWQEGVLLAEHMDGLAVDMEDLLHSISCGMI